MNSITYSHITPVRKTLHWLLIEHCPVFKTVLLVYKFRKSGYPKYFEPLHSVYNIRKSEADGVLLEIPHFATSGK